MARSRMKAAQHHDSRKADRGTHEEPKCRAPHHADCRSRPKTKNELTDCATQAKGQTFPRSPTATLAPRRNRNQAGHASCGSAKTDCQAKTAMGTGAP